MHVIYMSTFWVMFILESLREYLNLMSTYANYFCIMNKGINLKRLHNKVQEINKVKKYSLKNRIDP